MTGHCRGICDINADNKNWYRDGGMYCSKCTTRFGRDKFILMNTPVKRCMCCHERLRIKARIQRYNKEARDAARKYIE